jgi:hypothetical protein
MTIKTVYYNSSNPAGFPLKQNINNGKTTAKNGMPQKFRGADGGTSFAIGRNIFRNTVSNTVSLAELYAKQKSEGKYVTGKPIVTQSSDQHIQKIKNQAIGKGSMPGQFNNGPTELSFRPQIASTRNTTRAALRRCRSSGSVAPPKKGARPGC